VVGALCGFEDGIKKKKNLIVARSRELSLFVERGPDWLRESLMQRRKKKNVSKMKTFSFLLGTG
jgi:hypothetical protein